MPVGKKKSPAKFIGAVSLGIRRIKGVLLLLVVYKKRKRLRKENEIEHKSSMMI